MSKENFDNTKLELIYKNVFTCKMCGEKYGQDFNISKYELCPICEYALSSIKKKENYKRIKSSYINKIDRW